jgi:hypothetical protein
MKRLLLLATLFVQLASGALMLRAEVVDAPASLDLPAYITELGRWSGLVRRLREHPEEARMLRKQLPDHWAVAARGQRFQVSTEWLATALDHLASDSKLAASTSRELEDRLQLMLQDSQDLAQISESSPVKARAKLDEILKRREFRSVHAANAKEELWDQFIDWLWKLAGKLFNRVGSHPDATRVFLWGAVVALGLVFLGWLIYSISNVPFSTLSFRRKRLPPPEEEAAGTWNEWVQQARATAARGDYRDAVRIIYGAAVRRIAEGGAWQVDPARTHREYVRLLPPDSIQRPRFLAIISCFELVWYGSAKASATDYEAVLAELESL